MPDAISIPPTRLGSTAAPNAKRWFWICFLAVLAHALGLMVSIQGVIPYAEEAFGFTQIELVEILYGPASQLLYPAVIVIASFIAEKVGYRRLIISALVLQTCFAMVVLTSTTVFVTAGKNVTCVWLAVGFYLLTIGNGISVAVINPLVATLYPVDRTQFLNLLHAGWPAGIVIGSIAAVSGIVPPHIQILLFIIPVALCGSMIFGHDLTLTGTCDKTLTHGQKLPPFTGPLFLFLLSIQVMAHLVDNGLAIDQIRSTHDGTPLYSVIDPQGALIYSMVIMFALRCFAGRIAQTISTVELLLASSVLSTVGLLTLSGVNSPSTAIASLLIYSCGKAVLEPTMLAVVAQRFPQNIALSLGVFGALSQLLVGSLIFAGLGPGYVAQLGVLPIMSTVMGVCYSILICYFGPTDGYKALAKIRWPANQVLSIFLGWGSFGCIMGIVMNGEANNTQSFISQFLLKTIYGYFFGPIWSEFLFVWMSGMLLVAYIAVVIIFRIREHAEFAKFAFTVIFGFAMFSIWIEPWLTVTGLILNTVSIVLKTSILSIIDVGASICWFWARRRFHHAIDAAFAGPATDNHASPAEL